MIRSGFKRPTLARLRTVHTPVPEHLRRGSMATVADTPTPAIPKDEPIEHEGYRRLVASMACIHCGKQLRSQHAHLNEGKGKAMKLDDRQAMPLCADEPGAHGCHTQFDQYRLVPGGRDAHIELGRRWASMTRLAIYLAGLWPKNLPLWSEDT